MTSLSVRSQDDDRRVSARLTSAGQLDDFAYSSAPEKSTAT
jgi:hypothetical protein